MIDFTILNEGSAFAKLRKTVLASRSRRVPHQPFDAQLTLWKSHASPSWFGARYSNWQYSVMIEVETRFPGSLAFDSLMLRVMVPPSVSIPDDAVDTIRILLLENAHRISYSRFGITGLLQDDDVADSVRVVTLNGPKGIRFSTMNMSALCSSVPGRCTFLLTLALYYADTQVTNQVACALPPLGRLPESNRDGLCVPCIPLYSLPSSAGLTDPSIVQTLLESAAANAADSIMLSISAITETVWTSPEYGTLQQFEGWQCEFSSESRNSIFYIPTADATWIDESQAHDGHVRPSCWLTPALLMSCNTDATLAYLIALQSGARVLDQTKDEGARKYLLSKRDSTNMRLEAMEIEGVWRPCWFVPLELRGNRMVITADTGEIWAWDGVEVVKLRQQYWNR